MTNRELLNQFIQETGVAVQTQCYGSKLTTFSIGGILEYLVEPTSLEQLVRTISFLDQHEQGFRFIGNGSNLLISSDGLPGWFVRLGDGFKEIKQLDENRFEVGARYSLISLSKRTADMGLSGLEFASGIPGSVGGAVIMNAGAFGGQMANVIKSVSCVNKKGETQSIQRSDIDYAYRQSNLPKDLIVYSAEIELHSGEKEQIEACRQKYSEIRKSKQPLRFASAGSTFRNPNKETSAGSLIEQCGLKGTRVGGAIISEQHANWILNDTRTARHEDVLKLIELCQKNVLQKFGVQLVPELVIWDV